MRNSFLRVGKSRVTGNLITRTKTKSSHYEWKMTWRTHFSWNWMNEWTKWRFEVVVTSNARNKNLDDEIKENTKRRPILAPAIAVRLLIKLFDKKNCRLYSKNEETECLKWQQQHRLNRMQRQHQTKNSEPIMTAEVKMSNVFRAWSTASYL